MDVSSNALLISMIVAVPAALFGGIALGARSRRLACKELEQTLLAFADNEKKLERSRVARELHDGVCSTLIAARCWLDLALQHCPSPDTKSAQFCSRGLAELEGALREMRRISHNLQPAILSNYEFTEALGHMSREFSERTGIETRLLGATARINERLSMPARTALVRILQEALANVEKHSAASRVVLELQERHGSLTLKIADDGHGFCRLMDRESGGGVGVNNMRERLAEIGGTLTLRFSPASTEVVAQAPLLSAAPKQSTGSIRTVTGTLQ